MSPAPDSAPPRRFTVDQETVFLLGNGPTLAKIDLAAFSGRATIGMNAAYRYWRRIDWRPRFYACLDHVVGMSHLEGIRDLIEEGRIERFILRGNLVAALGAHACGERVVNFDALRVSAPILACEPVTTGSHAALWAASAGFRKIVLLGIDGNYVETVPGARLRSGIELEIVEEGHNPNYFFEGYQQRGDRYNIPNPRTGLHVEAWRVAALGLAEAGVEAVNGNRESEVRFFPFVSAADLLSADGAIVDEGGACAPRPDMPGGSRFRDFISRQRLLAGAGLAVAIGGAASALLIAPTAFAAVATAFAALLIASLFAATACIRHAASSHIAKLDARVKALEIALADAERRRGGVSHHGKTDRASRAG